MCNCEKLMHLKACLHGGGGPQVGEVTRFGGVTHPAVHIISHFNFITFLYDSWGDPPQVISPTWGPPPPCKQALSSYK